MQPTAPLPWAPVLNTATPFEPLDATTAWPPASATSRGCESARAGEHPPPPPSRKQRWAPVRSAENCVSASLDTTHTSTLSAATAAGASSSGAGLHPLSAAAAQPAYARPSPLRLNHRTASVSRAVT